LAPNKKQSDLLSNLFDNAFIFSSIMIRINIKMSFLNLINICDYIAINSLNLSDLFSLFIFFILREIQLNINIEDYIIKIIIFITILELYFKYDNLNKNYNNIQKNKDEEKIKDNSLQYDIDNKIIVLNIYIKFFSVWIVLLTQTYSIKNNFILLIFEIISMYSTFFNKIEINHIIFLYLQSIIIALSIISFIFKLSDESIAPIILFLFSLRFLYIMKFDYKNHNHLKGNYFIKKAMYLLY